MDALLNTGERDGVGRLELGLGRESHRDTENTEPVRGD
jgi:hypothetical protein